VLGLQIIGSGLYQALGKPKQSLFLALVRQVIFLIPLVLILPLFFSLNGIWAAFPVADFLAALVTIIMVYMQMRILRRNQNLKQA